MRHALRDQARDGNGIVSGAMCTAIAVVIEVASANTTSVTASAAAKGANVSGVDHQDMHGRDLGQKKSSRKGE